MPDLVDRKAFGLGLDAALAGHDIGAAPSVRASWSLAVVNGPDAMAPELQHLTV